MHPIEHLRYVARSHAIAPATLASEAASALGSLRTDPANLVVACRRIVERHPEVGQLWWLCARLLVADDPSRLAWELADRLADDPVGDVLAHELPADATVMTVGGSDLTARALMHRDDVSARAAEGWFGRGDLPERTDGVLIEAAAVSAGRALAPAGSRVAAMLARAAGTPVWLIAGTGTRLPIPYVDEIAHRVLPDAPRDPLADPPLDDLPLEVVDAVVTESGLAPPSALRPDCPFAPELLRPGIA